ncbi:zinc finger protein 664 isoform X3 [Heterocephalus glaber]|uniref:Zinc finger protein 664 isoform X3 n=1 Tax=Heterocephalus glaber TaxID=10181 RepID=A0AAX6SXY2_HETGA|nr:zinc finger protein 664 isoform X3 [Heterocephalus glaber]
MYVHQEGLALTRGPHRDLGERPADPGDSPREESKGSWFLWTKEKTGEPPFLRSKTPAWALEVLWEGFLSDVEEAERHTDSSREPAGAHGQPASSLPGHPGTHWVALSLDVRSMRLLSKKILGS